jgi:hypothetical protein
MDGTSLSLIGKKWTREEFEQQRTRTRDEVSAEIAANPSLDRAHAAMNKLSANQDDITPNGLMRNFVLIMIALQEHRHNRNLNDRDVRRLADFAHKILTVANIKPVESSLAFLYGDLHLVLSQIQRGEGLQNESAWEQIMSTHLGGGASSRGKELHTLAAGFRAMRIGHGKVALSRLNQVLNLDQAEPAQRARALLGLVICARLRRDAPTFESLLAQSTGLNFTPDELLELEWERACFDASRDCNLDQLINKVSRRGTHRSSIYEVEAKLWSWAIKERRWLDSVPRIKSILARPEGEASVRNTLVKWASQFETLLDSEIPYTERLRRAGDLFHDSEQLDSIDKQALALACLARWLSRNRAYEFAALTLGRLEILSLGISGGTVSDSVGVVGDLLNEVWYQRTSDKTDQVA